MEAEMAEALKLMHEKEARKEEVRKASSVIARIATPGAPLPRLASSSSGSSGVGTLGSGMPATEQRGATPRLQTPRGRFGL